MHTDLSTSTVVVSELAGIHAADSFVHDKLNTYTHL